MQENTNHLEHAPALDGRPIKPSKGDVPYPLPTLRANGKISRGPKGEIGYVAPGERILKPSEVAWQIGISTPTLHAWRKSGWVLAVVLPNGRYGIPETELDRLKINAPGIANVRRARDVTAEERAAIERGTDLP